MLGPADPADPADLAGLCRRIDDHEYGRRVVPTHREDVDRLREIGNAANSHGGFPAMLALAQQAASQYRNALNTTNVHWSGIGEWQS